MDKREFHSYDAQKLDLDVQGLLIGANLTREKVIAEICPSCPFQTPICQWLLEKVWLPDEKARFACPGMRAWIIQSG